MAFPVSTITGTTTWLDWRTAFNTLKDGVVESIESASDPAVSDDGYVVGSIWTNTTTHKTFICNDNATSTAVWIQIFSSTYLLARGNHTGTQAMSTISDAGSIATHDYWSGTQTAYDALGSWDSNTIYFVT